MFPTRLSAAAVLTVAVAVLAAGCAARGGVPRPRPFPGATLPPAAPAPVPEPTPDTDTVSPATVNTALTLRGIPYRNGGTTPSDGFDCSGFVQWVFAQHGVLLPREVRDQYRAGREIDQDDIRAGDLVFFETVSRGASHVGIALGDGTFVHAPSSQGVVRVESYAIEYWSKRWMGARRVEPLPELATD